MAELAVKVPYTNNSRALILSSLKLSFPVWGVAFPGIAVVVFTMQFFNVVASSPESKTILWFAGSFGLLLLFSLALLTVRWLSGDEITISRDGITLPFSPFAPRRNLDWDKILKVQIAGPLGSPWEGGKNWKTANIVIVSDKKQQSISCSHLQEEDLEKLLISLEMWAPHGTIDDTVGSLKDGLTGSDTRLLQSYTDMWEEDLTRRFCATAFVPLDPGIVLRNGSLKVVRHLAMGGLSAVYLCQIDGKKLVVLKEAVVSDDTSESAQSKAREMLDREAAHLLKLKHSNVVKVLDYFVEQGRNYLMLDYISGQDLRQLVKQNGPQKEELVLEWAVTMASILKYLHEQDPPIIHRDFTPDNLVLAEDGAIYVIDFGASNEFIGTATGTFVGKQSFVAPEQFRGKAVVQSDIYALGCTLYFLLTGNEPEALSTSDPREIDNALSREIGELVVSCTQMEAKDRYQSAAQLIPVLMRLAAVS